MHVPLVDLSAQLPLIEQEIREGWTRVINQGGFILGDDVAALEVELAAFSGSRHCIGVANGTDAIELACRALGIGVGDEVILPANTFIATALGVARAGATPVLVDIDPVYHLIDPQQVARRITSKTRAILPVHLFGQMAPMRPLLELAQAHELSLIEDCAQAHGARQYGQRAGTLGAAAAYSFYPGKNLGAFGDAGAVTTDHAPLATKLYGLRNYGSQIKYHHPELGFNSRLDTLQAVVLRAKLKHLERWNAARRAAAQRYDTLLAPLMAAKRPQTLLGNEHVHHLYVVRVPERERVLTHLRDHGVGAGVHYPVPIHLQGAFARLGHSRGDFPHTERAAAEVLSLPMFPEISAAQQNYVVERLAEALTQHAA